MKSLPSALYSGLGIALIVLGLTLTLLATDTTSAKLFCSALAVLGVALAAYGVRKRVEHEDPGPVPREMT